MTQLSRLATLGMGKESTPGTYTIPTFWVPFSKADFEDTIVELKDESVRGNDAVLQGVYAGPITASWSIDVDAYPDILGNWLRATIGPDTVTAGVATTLASSSSPGTSISTAASIPAQSIIMVDTGANLEYAKTTAVSGSGPYTLTLAAPGLTLSHSSAVAVVSQTSHLFKQSAAALPSYSMTVYDTTATTGWPGCKASEAQIKIDPKAKVTLGTKWLGFPSATQSPATAAYTTPDPLLGWEWTMTNAGGASTRGLSFDLNIKRHVEAIHSSDGTQGPREIFSGAIETDFTYKAIFENQTDLNLYLNYSQQPATATLTQPTTRGGASLALTMSKSGWVKGKRELGSQYVEASFSGAGIYNSTDGGVVQATLNNFTSASY